MEQQGVQSSEGKKSNLRMSSLAELLGKYKDNGHNNVKFKYPQKIRNTKMSQPKIWQEKL